MLRVYGIRHHGPGSAKRLRKALQDQHPDIVLVEAPAEAETAFRYVGEEDLTPPVSILVYDPKDLQQAAYLPFARFSPEWQAALYANRRGIPLRPCDLPMGIGFGLQQPERAPDLWRLDEEERRLQLDPLGFLARLAGYSDSERWWEVTFEQDEDEAEVFRLILEMMQHLRRETDRNETEETLLREAHMRKIIRKTVKEGYQNIAVICGAWHAPVLHDYEKFTQKADNQRLRGLKKDKLKATWIPWSYDRLARQSGYAAGVISPAWYDLLFSNRKEVSARWMSKAARLMRRHNLDASTLHAMEAVRLAETLAGLRGKSIAGIDELREAALSVFCEGQSRRLALVEEQLIIGGVTGKVPNDIPLIPLQQDLEKQIKAARLTKEKQTTEQLTKTLDLRKPANLKASRLLHRLNALDIPWGALREASETSLGGFQETWRLKWKADFAIRIIQAGGWGNTVAEAALQKLIRQGSEAEDLAGLSRLMQAALQADLPGAVATISKYLEEKAALDRDVLELLEIIPLLVRIIRYGDTRQTDTFSVQHILEQVAPRVCVGLPRICLGIQEELARSVFDHLIAAHHHLLLLNREEFVSDWLGALDQIAQLETTHPLLRGGCVRILFDKAVWTSEHTRRSTYHALSRANEPTDAAAWLEGFLHGSGQMLLHQGDLWKLIDEWVDQLEWETFQNTLPILRRIFARFSETEKTKMLELARFGPPEPAGAGMSDQYNPERARKMYPTLKLLLALEPDLKSS